MPETHPGISIASTPRMRVWSCTVLVALAMLAGPNARGTKTHPTNRTSGLGKRTNPYRNLSGSPTQLRLPFESWYRDGRFLWTPGLHREHAGRTIEIEWQDGSLLKQQPVLLEDFSASEQKLMRKLLRRSVETRAVRKAKEHAYRDRFRHFERLPRTSPDDEEADRVLSQRAAANVSFVEAGAWRLELAGGDHLVALMSSSRAKTITNADLNKSLNGRLRSARVSPLEVTSIQFFHDHPPSGGPNLSTGDLAFMLSTKRAFVALGIEAPVHFYVISEAAGERLVFHSSISTEDHEPSLSHR